jgi:hypothetical protein
MKKASRGKTPLGVKRRAQKRRRVSGCYAVGRARIRRRKMNPRRRPITNCYAVGRARIRRRKVNRRAKPRRGLVVLYAHKPGGKRLKFLGNSKFGAKGRAVLFKDLASANLAAWVLKDSFPEILRGYTLTAVAE